MADYPFAPTVIPVSQGGTGLTAAGTTGQLLGISGAAPAWVTGLTLVAATAVAGYSLINGTGNVVTWTPPNDGNQHRVVTLSSMHVSTNNTGGQITLAYNSPDGTATNHSLYGAGAAAGVNFPSPPLTVIVQAGQIVTVAQATALTAGGPAVMWVELWGS